MTCFAVPVELSLGSVDHATIAKLHLLCGLQFSWSRRLENRTACLAREEFGIPPEPLLKLTMIELRERIGTSFMKRKNRPVGPEQLM